MTWTEKQQAVEREIARHRERWGETFGLRASPGEKFQIVEGASFYAESGVVLYTYRWSEEEQEWLASAKGSPDELHRQSVKLRWNERVDWAWVERESRAKGLVRDLAELEAHYEAKLTHEIECGRARANRVDQLIAEVAYLREELSRYKESK